MSFLNKTHATIPTATTDNRMGNQKVGIGMSYTQVMLVCAIPTIIAAILSFYLVERPMIRLSHWLVKKMKKKG